MRNDAPDPENHHTPAPLFDPGWLFLIAGLGLLLAVVLISAGSDLAEARWQRDRAIALEQRQRDRLERHESYLHALERPSPRLARSLAARQLNLVRADRAVLADPFVDLPADADVFPDLEPPPARAPELRRPDSVLQRLAEGESSRLWLIALGSLSVLVGLLGPWSREMR